MQKQFFQYCYKSESQECIIQYIKSEDKKDIQINKVKKQLKTESWKRVDEEEIKMVNTIVNMCKYLKREDSFIKNQVLLGFNLLFRSFVAKTWVETEMQNIIYRKYSRIIYKIYIEFYYKYGID